MENDKRSERPSGNGGIKVEDVEYEKGQEEV